MTLLRALPRLLAVAALAGIGGALFAYFFLGATP